MAKTNGNGGDPLVWIIGVASLFFLGNRLFNEAKKTKKDARQAKKGAGFGGADTAYFHQKGYKAMQRVIKARSEGKTVGHPLNPYHGGEWQEAAFDRGVEAAKRQHREDMMVWRDNMRARV